jgi:hypothetical protein
VNSELSRTGLPRAGAARQRCAGKGLEMSERVPHRHNVIAPRVPFHLRTGICYLYLVNHGKRASHRMKVAKHGFHVIRVDSFVQGHKRFTQ